MLKAENQGQIIIRGEWIIIRKEWGDKLQRLTKVFAIGRWGKFVSKDQSLPARIKWRLD